MATKELEMRFDPQTINHLGLRMYSTLPPALAEIISNAYDADAENVIITLSEEAKSPKGIKVEDDGTGMSFDDIKTKFLVIGRNRRQDGDQPSKKFERLPTGKKGLGKLALFGLAKTITVSTRQNGKLNEFVLDWDDLMEADSAYHPRAIKIDESTTDNDGTTISLTGLKRKTEFDFLGLADSLSKIFIFDDNFHLLLKSPRGDKISIDNKRKYSTLNKEFDWSLDSTLLVPKTCEYYGKIYGELLTSEKPITPSSGLRGITLFSRGKLVNAPEFFSSSTSSHFYQYLTGWICADFIDLLDDDVISTNRQSIDWEYPEMAKFRKFLSGIVSQINADWRKRRKEKKDKDLREKTGIDTGKWIGTMPDDMKSNMSQIIDTLGGEDALEKFTPVIKALHNIAPEYPYYHWRNLHEEIREAALNYYKNEDYYSAFLEAIKKYSNATRTKSRAPHSICDDDLMAKAFHLKSGSLTVTPNYVRANGQAFPPLTLQNIQEGHFNFSKGVVAGGRNPVAHEEVNDLKTSDLFSEKDCLDLLSLISHLFKRLDKAKVKDQK